MANKVVGNALVPQEEPDAFVTIAKLVDSLLVIVRRRAQQ
jgi:hypothetical protein